MKRWLMHGLEILLIVLILAVTFTAWLYSPADVYDDVGRECNQP